LEVELFKYLGPGFLVTVGFIDPGNWAANVAAGSNYGYSLLWMVTLSTLMLILLQHNAAHLGIVTGLCLSEACAKYFGRGVSGWLLGSAVGASVSTALAEVLGTAIGLNMLFGLPLAAGAFLSSGLVLYMIFSNSYPRLEKWILGFVSLIGIAFLLELSMVKIPWSEAARAWVVPSLPAGSLPVVMSVLGAVVMPHNLFLHSEVIQSRQWNLQGEEVIQKQLKFEYADTLVAMLVGWAINSTMILVAASVFHTHGVVVTELPQAQATLKPLLGNAAAVIFAGLLFPAFPLLPRDGRGKHLCRDFPEALQQFGPPFADGNLRDSIRRPGDHPLHPGSFPRTSLEPDYLEHSAPADDCPPDPPDLLLQSHGEIRQLAGESNSPLGRCFRGPILKRHAPDPNRLKKILPCEVLGSFLRRNKPSRRNPQAARMGIKLQDPDLQGRDKKAFREIDGLGVKWEKILGVSERVRNEEIK
jgi:NRAMP (natural resistance-associated macrophage protein)-like metal ion transporter